MQPFGSGLDVDPGVHRKQYPHVVLSDDDVAT